MVIDGVDGLRALAGRHVGETEWLEVTQDRVNRFADATKPGVVARTLFRYYF